MSISYDGQTLSNASVFDDDAGVLCIATKLLSGKVSVQASSETGFTPSFRCHTTDASEISTLKGKIGSSATLVIDSTSYTNCYIQKFKSSEHAPGKYQYEIEFVRSTA